MHMYLWNYKRLPKIITTVIIVLLFFFAFTQEAIAGVKGKIAGFVTDAETGEPLPGINIIIVDTDMGAAGDVNGYYYVINIPPGTYSVEARMMGYESITKSEVEVTADHTTPINFELRPVAVEVPGITVSAKREIVKMDVSSSLIASKAAEIEVVPLVNDIADYITLQAGVEGLEFRGGGLDQTAFMVDGLMLVDNRANTPITMPNLSSVLELNMIKGGFNAEFSNVRSGLVNIVTKEGDPKEYHGSMDFRISPPYLKHDGYSLFDHDNFYLRPYLEEDDSVCWLGTGQWPDSIASQYRSFEGWIAHSEELMGDDDPTNDRTPEQCRDLFIWRHMAEGSENLDEVPGQPARPAKEYGHLPDWTVDVGFGGPVPGIGKYLGDLTFYVSHRNNWEMFGLPSYRDYYKEKNTQIKFTSRITQSMKLKLEGLYGEINSLAYESGENAYLRSGEDIFYHGEALSAHTVAEESFYYFADRCPFDVYNSMLGLTFDHVLSDNTFYTVGISRAHVKNYSPGPWRMRDTTTLGYFGNTPIDEAPLGFWSAGGKKIMVGGMRYTVPGAQSRDWSGVTTYNVKFDMTSQINRLNQIKLGAEFNYDEIHNNHAFIRVDAMAYNWSSKWDHYPYRVGAYIQDKIEFEGLIANLGLRLDYNEPNTEWFTIDRYSDFLRKRYMDTFTEVAPKEPAEGHIKISPRIGVSHPISENAKLYFNYGHFYSMPKSRDMYRIGLSNMYGIYWLGNPSANLPRTVAYELGLEYNIADLFLLHIAGYYKDITDQTGEVQYTNIDGGVDYTTIENNNYEDIRGFEISLRKSVGRWITGWVNYDYMVTTSGYIGRNHYYEDERMQRVYGLQNPYQEKPLPRPVLNAQITLSSPEDWGPMVASIKPFSNIHLSLLYSWRAGKYETWDPLETYTLFNNVQWKAIYVYDARLSKEIKFGEYGLNFFIDIKNLFNTKYIHEGGFENTSDREKYFESLHLPMYEGDEYQAVGYTSGNDRPGDIKSKDKPYIDMPNRKFLTYVNVRTFVFGLSINF